MDMGEYKEFGGKLYVFFDSYRNKPDAECVAKKLREHGYARIESIRIDKKYTMDKKSYTLYQVWKSLRARTKMPDHEWVRWGE